MFVGSALSLTLLQRPPPLPRFSSEPFPGTTALASPIGFEAAYETLREIRAQTGKPLVYLNEVAAHNPSAAAHIQQRVNFNVPTTRREAASTFFRHPTAQFISGALMLSVAARVRMAVAFSAADAAAAVATAVFWAFQEWWIHDKLLHSPQPWFGRTVHRWHHELPYYHVSLDGIGLAAVWFGAVAAVLVGAGALTSTLAPCLSALAAYTLCGGLYEASHYLAHTKCPLPPALNRMRRHHACHHTVDERYWLAFTVPAIDTLLRTNPTPKDVARAHRQARRHERGDMAAAPAPPAPPRRSRSARMEAEAAATAPTYAPTTLHAQLPGLLRMARLNALPMGAALVGFGAFGARRVTVRAPPVHQAAKLALGTTLTMIVTAGSMLINDYHDHKLGVDTALTKPGRPLVTGEVHPEAVKLVLKWGYAAHLTLLCLVETAPMRLWVLGNTLLTYLYSVHLKPITFVKNAVCAAIVAMAVGLGALAVDGTLACLAAVWRPMVAVAGLICHREIVMDIKDMRGDGLAGVRTLPVALGARAALQCSMLPLAVAVGAAATAPSRALALAATTPLLLQAVFALRALGGGFEPPRMVAAIELAPLWLAATLVALTL